MGGNLPATISFMVALGLVVVVIVTAFRRKLLVTCATTVPCLPDDVYESLGSQQLFAGIFYPWRLQVVAQSSPLIFFLVTLVLGIICVVWMLRLTAAALKNKERL